MSTTFFTETPATSKIELDSILSRIKREKVSIASKISSAIKQGCEVESAEFQHDFLVSCRLSFNKKNPYLNQSHHHGFVNVKVADNIVSQASSSKGWHSCRETFSNDCPCGIKTFFFGLQNPAEAYNIAFFFRFLEERLGNKNNIYFQLTENPKILCVHLSEFWNVNFARLQALTILLRSATAFVDSFDKALYSDKYASATRSAITKFVEGYNSLPENEIKEMISGNGWVNYFKRTGKLEKLTKVPSK